jgi:hypothetical protein
LKIGTRTGILFALMPLTVVSAAFAHHSAAATYEANESIRITGTVLEFRWTNPHCHAYISVTEGPFKGRTYTIELSSPVALVRDGWNETLLQPGDDVTMEVHPSRDRAAVGLCRRCAVTVNGSLKKTSGKLKETRDLRRRRVA